MKNKRPKYSERTLREIAAVLTQFCFINNEEVANKIHDLMKVYGLEDDPFTHLPCSPGEYYENRKSYERQLMEEKFGYYED